MNKQCKGWRRDCSVLQAAVTKVALGGFQQVAISFCLGGELKTKLAVWIFISCCMEVFSL